MDRARKEQRAFVARPGLEKRRDVVDAPAQGRAWTFQRSAGAHPRKPPRRGAATAVVDRRCSGCSGGRLQLGGLRLVAAGSGGRTARCRSRHTIALSCRSGPAGVRRGDHGNAVSLALEALPDERRGVTRPDLPAAELVLYEAVIALREQRVLSAKDANGFFAATWSSDGQRIYALLRRPFQYSPVMECREWPTNRAAARRHRIGGVFAQRQADHRRKGQQEIEILDAADGKSLLTFASDNMMSAARFSPDDARIVATVPESVRSFPRCGPARRTTEAYCLAVGGQVWNVADGTTLKLPTEVKFADFSPDGQELVATMDDGTAQIWDLARRAPLHVLNQTTDRSERENRIATSVFSPDGRHILTTQLGAGVWLWNATSRARIALEDSGPISSAVFSPDGRYILAIHAAGGASLWSADGYARIARLERSESISHAAFSPDGKRILGVAERSLLIWETENPASIVARASADGGIGSPRLSSDGQRVVWIGANNTVRMWVAAAGGDITVVGRHRDRVRTAEFSPDGRFIVTSSDDGTARIWDGTDGAVRVLRGTQGRSCPRLFPRTASGSSPPRPTLPPAHGMRRPVPCWLRSRSSRPRRRPSLPTGGGWSLHRATRSFACGTWPAMHRRSSCPDTRGPARRSQSHLMRQESSRAPWTEWRACGMSHRAPRPWRSAGFQQTPCSSDSLTTDGGWLPGRTPRRGCGTSPMASWSRHSANSRRSTV